MTCWLLYFREAVPATARSTSGVFSRSMAFPIPSESRSLREKLWRAPAPVNLVDRVAGAAATYVHRDAAKRQADQEAFERNAAGLFRRFANREFIPHCSLRHIEAPIRRERSPMRRPAHHIRPLDAVDEARLFTNPTGMSERPAIREAQTVLEKAHGTHETWPPAAYSIGGKRIYVVSADDALKKSRAGDMSLKVTGVKKFHREMQLLQEERSTVAAQSFSLTPDPVLYDASRTAAGASLNTGFLKGIGTFDLPARPAGKATVKVEKFDPLHFKEMYGREHYGYGS